LLLLLLLFQIISFVVSLCVVLAKNILI